MTNNMARRRKLPPMKSGLGGGMFNLTEGLLALGQWHDDQLYGEIVPPPILSWMYEHGDFRRFVQYIWVTLPRGIPAWQLEAVLQAVLDNHDTLRSRLDVVDGKYRFATRKPGAVQAPGILTRIAVAADDDAVTTHVRAAINRINPFTGAMFQALWCQAPDADSGHLLLVVHHLAMDVVSWYVLAVSIADAWEQISNPKKAALSSSEEQRPSREPTNWGSQLHINLTGERTTYRQWAWLMERRSQRPEVDKQRDYWLAQLAGADPALGSRMPDPQRDTWASLRATEMITGVEETRVLLNKLTSVWPETSVREFLLTALTVTLTTWRLRRGNAPAPDDEGLLLSLESHGRRDDLIEPNTDWSAEQVDTSSTVGWFTQIFPVFLRAGRRVDVATVRKDPSVALQLLQVVTECVAAVPNEGLDYGLLRYQRRDPDLVAAHAPQVVFNYIGRLDLGQVPQAEPGRHEVSSQASSWNLVTDNRFNGNVPPVPEPGLPLRYVFDLTAMVRATAAGPELTAYWRWSDLLTTEEEAAEMAVLWSDAVTALAAALG